MTFRTKLFTAFSSVWAVFIFSNSIKTGSQSAVASDSIVDRLVDFLNVPFDVDLMTVIIRKAGHFTEFLLLGLLISLCFYYAKKRFRYSIMTILFLCLSAGVFDEFLQSFITGRSSEVRDVLIDFAGCATGLIVVYLMDKRRFKRGR